MPAVRTTNVGSPNGLVKAPSVSFLLAGGIREVIVKLAKIRRARMRKAQIRIVQPNPTCGMSLMTMTGKIMPPREDPEAMMPIAAPRFLKNQVDVYNLEF
jgi:hypothetical protein